MKRKRVAILGSTGSIGTQALEVIARHADRFEVVGLAAGLRVERLKEQADRFGVRFVASAADGAAGLFDVAACSGADVLLAATDGFVAFDAVFAAVERGIDLAVANKELIVAAGEALAQSAKRSGSRIVPVDSEHSAVFQCLEGEDRTSVQTIVLTASGGPFWRKTREEMETVTVAEALAHPKWRMGAKNSIDSATMMNKGLEVIEASRLFEVPAETIEVVVHPQSIVHGFVRFTDGNVKAQIAAPDMRLPIGYALAYPGRLRQHSPEVDTLQALGADRTNCELRYDFEPPDFERFPCLALAYQALRAGGTTPAILSAANETAVEAFLQGRIPFARISRVVEDVVRDVRAEAANVRSIRDADAAARKVARATISQFAGVYKEER